MLTHANIRAVFFDVGGVLIEDNSIEILKRQSKLLGIQFKDLRDDMRADRIRLMKGMITRREYLQRISHHFQLPPIAVQDLKPLFRPQRYFKKNWAIAERLRRKGYVVGIISNAMPPFPFAKKSNPFRVFRPVIMSWQVKSVKPEKRIFEIASKRAKVKFSEMAFFDDKPRNVRAAKALGISAFVYKNPEDFKRKLRTVGVVA